MILIDTGPIVALFDKNDNYHDKCLSLLKTIKEPLITTMPVLTKAFYLLGFSWQVQDALWEFVNQGGIQIYDLKGEQFKRCRELMKKYKDPPMDLADATIVSAAETVNISTIFTIDKDFRVYRTKQGKNFRLIPGQ